MRPAMATANTKPPDSLAIVLGLLMFSVFINYIDRGNSPSLPPC